MAKHSVFMLATLVATTAIVVSSTPCVPLPSCDYAMALLANRDSLPGMTRADVFGRIRALTCGVEGNTPTVRCPEEEEEDGGEDMDEVAMGEIVARGGGVFDTTNVLNNPRQCNGQLKMTYYSLRDVRHILIRICCVGHSSIKSIIVCTL